MKSRYLVLVSAAAFAALGTIVSSIETDGIETNSNINIIAEAEVEAEPVKETSGAEMKVEVVSASKKTAPTSTLATATTKKPTTTTTVATIKQSTAQKTTAQAKKTSEVKKSTAKTETKKTDVVKNTTEKPVVVAAMKEEKPSTKTEAKVESIAQVQTEAIIEQPTNNPEISDNIIASSILSESLVVEDGSSTEITDISDNLEEDVQNEDQNVDVQNTTKRAAKQNDEKSSETDKDDDEGSEEHDESSEATLQTDLASKNNQINDASNLNAEE